MLVKIVLTLLMVPNATHSAYYSLPQNVCGTQIRYNSLLPHYVPSKKKRQRFVGENVQLWPVVVILKYYVVSIRMKGLTLER